MYILNYKSVWTSELNLCGAWEFSPFWRCRIFSGDMWQSWELTVMGFFFLRATHSHLADFRRWSAIMWCLDNNQHKLDAKTIFIGRSLPPPPQGPPPPSPSTPTSLPKHPHQTNSNNLTFISDIFSKLSNNNRLQDTVWCEKELFRRKEFLNFLSKQNTFYQRMEKIKRTVFSTTALNVLLLLWKDSVKLMKSDCKRIRLFHLFIYLSWKRRGRGCFLSYLHLYLFS